jgi:hypothetical protein
VAQVQRQTPTSIPALGRPVRWEELPDRDRVARGPGEAQGPRPTTQHPETHRMTTTATTLKLPASIKDLDLKFAKALNVPVPKLWPKNDEDKDEKFLGAEQPAAIAHVFTHSTELHQRLFRARIAYLFRPSIEKGGRERGGVASKASAKLEYLTDFDFLIEFNHGVWLKLTPEQRLALVDHELAHCERDPETGAWTMREHDVEEFSDVVARWGLWTMPLRGFGYAIERAQIDLFDGTAVGLIEEAAPAIAEAVKGALKKTAGKKRGRQKEHDDAGSFELEDDDTELE